MAMQPAPNNKLDRQTTTPFHLKLFYRASSFHSPSEFPTSTPSPLPPHLQIYTWPTCTLRELSHLLVSALPSLLPSPAIGTRLAYRLIYPDTHPSHPQAPGRYLSKELGNVVVGSEEGGGRGILPSEEEGKLVKGGVMAGYLEGEPDKTLQDARFVIGDFVCCAIFKPGEDGGVVGVPRGIGNGRGRGEFGGGRGGYGGGFGRGRGGGGRGGGGLFNGDSGRLGGEGVPAGEWRRGERVPEGPGGYGRGRGRGF